MVWAYILSYKVVFSEKIKIKILDLQNIRRSLLKSCKQSPLQRRKRVFITVMRNAWIPQLWERCASSLNS